MHPISTMEGGAALLGRTLVLVAHPDDEVIGCGALLQRVKQAVVVFCTDGAPYDGYFWGRYGSREAYALLRQDEARRALSCVGETVEPLFLAERNPAFVDQQLFRFLPQAFDALDKVITEWRPDALLTLAYEGGHPDHDACCFLSAQLAKLHALEAWEFPLYHRSVDGVGVRQEFAIPGDHQFVLQATAGEQDIKRAMLQAYASQGNIIAQFGVEFERVRRLADYDFSRPPLSGVLNYEAWQWQITGAEVAESFTRFLDRNCAPDLARQGL